MAALLLMTSHYSRGGARIQPSAAGPPAAAPDGRDGDRRGL